MDEKEMEKRKTMVLQLLREKKYKDAVALAAPIAENDKTGTLCECLYVCYFFLGDLEAGYKYIELAGTMGSNNPNLIPHKINYLFNKGKLPELSIYLNAQLEQAPGSFLLHREKARMFLQFHQLDVAYLHLQEAIKAIPGDAESLGLLIHILTTQKQLGQALHYCDQLKASLAKEPHFISEYHFLLAKVYYFIEDETAAIGTSSVELLNSYKVCINARQAGQLDYKGLNQLADIFSRAEMFYEAIKVLDEAIAANHSNHEAHEKKGDLFLIQKNYEEAVKAYEKSNIKNEARENPLFNMGVCQFRLNRVAESEQSFKKALDVSMQKSYADKKILLGKFTAFSDLLLTSTLAEKEIWFSNPVGFNDPLDGNYLSKLYENITPLKEQMSKFLVTCFRYFTESEDPFKIFCSNEQLLWSHYAARHKGVMLVYETIPNFNPDIIKKDAIRYVKQFEYLPKCDRRMVNESFLATLKNNFFTKYDEWEYEKEYRLIKYEEGSSNRPGKCYSLEELNIKLKGVVFGLNCAEETKEAISKTVAANYEYPIELIEITQGSEHANHYELFKQRYAFI